MLLVCCTEKSGVLDPQHPKICTCEIHQAVGFEGPVALRIAELDRVDPAISRVDNSLARIHEAASHTHEVLGSRFPQINLPVRLEPIIQKYVARNFSSPGVERYIFAGSSHQAIPARECEK